MRVYILLLLLLCCTQTSYAEVVGTVHLTIKNMPPRIEEAAIIPGTVYADTIPSCEYRIVDEVPDSVIVDEQVLVNGMKFEKTQLQEGDVVECILLPEDSAGQQGEEASVSSVVQKKEFSLANSASGIVDKGVSMSRQGMRSITGMVTGNSRDSGLLTALSLIIVLTFINLNLFIRYMMRRRIRNVSS